jgi:hypothetical protein
MAEYKVEHLNSLQRKAKFDEVMKTHSGWVDKLRKNAQTNHYMKKAGKCGDIVVTGYLQNQSHALKQQVTLEAVSEIKKAFWFPKQVHVYCDDDELSRGYIAQKTNTIYEAHIGLGKSSISYVRAATGADAQYYKDFKYGGPWDGASWRLFADTVYESTRGDEQKKKKARLKAAVLHEIGHILWQMNEATDYYMFQQNLDFVKPMKNWVDLAKNVSYSATVNLNEFVAELFSAFWSGERFTTETVELYTAIGGPFPDTFSLLKEIKSGIGSLSKPSI